MKTHSLEFHVDFPENVDLFQKIDQYATTHKMRAIKTMKPGEFGTHVKLVAIANPASIYKFHIWAYKNIEDGTEYEVATDDEKKFSEIMGMFKEMQ